MVNRKDKRIASPYQEHVNNITWVYTQRQEDSETTKDSPLDMIETTFDSSNTP